MAEPKLRFKDEQGREYPEWKRQKLGNIFVQTNNYSTLDDKKELYSLTVENGITPKTERYDRSFLVKKNDKFKIVHKNEFVYNPMNMTIGAVGYNNLRKDIIVSGYYVVMKSNNVSTNEYWYNWLKSPKTIRLFKQKATGSLIEKQRIQFSTFEKIKADIPSLPEQQKIADFLTTVDRQIDIQSQRVEAMKVRKKGLLQKIFSQEIRFKDDEGKDYPEWDEKKIGEFSQCIAGATPSTKEPRYWENGNIPWMSSGEVNNRIICSTEKKISSLGYENSSTKMLPENTVVIALAGQGKTRGMVAITRIRLCTNQSLCGIVTDSSILSDYLYQFLLTQYEYLRLISSGDGTRGGLNLKIVKDCNIPVPTLPEQQKIADFLTAVDKQIEVEEKRLKTMKTIKKGLLQQMFI